MKCRLMSRNREVHEASETQPTIDEGQRLELAERPFGGPFLMQAATLLLHSLISGGP